jgi:ribosomal protein S18 acetylase RimI-like enzyme
MSELSDLLIRHCRAEDLDDLEWDGEFTHDRPIIDATFTRTRDDTMAMFLAEVDGMLAGQVWLDLDRERAAAKLWALRVKPRWRGHGIGAHLLATAEHESARRGFACVELEVEPGNAAARRLYERHRYEPVRYDDAVGYLVLRKSMA